MISIFLILLHENARPNTAREKQALLLEQFHWDIFEHPAYSPDWAPSEFFRFPKIKEHLADKFRRLIQIEVNVQV